jgi:hypothetical protein
VACIREPSVKGRAGSDVATGLYNRGMATKPEAKPRTLKGTSGPWTAVEIAREERANSVRARRDREKTPEERLEETLRLSRFVSELRDGL